MCPLVGVWRSLVAHLLWEQGVQGSNPCTPTNFPLFQVFKIPGIRPNTYCLGCDS